MQVIIEQIKDEFNDCCLIYIRTLHLQVREYHASGDGKGMCTGRPGWQVPSEKNEEKTKKKDKDQCKYRQARLAGIQ